MRILFLLFFLAFAACIDSGKSQEIKDGMAGEAKLTASTNTSAVASEWSVIPGRILVKNRTLHDMIQIVYPGSHPLVDEAGLGSERFDLLIEGRNAAGDAFWVSFQKVLREKFLLFTVEDKRQIDIYELTTGKEKPDALVESTPEQKRSDQTTAKGWEFTGFSMEDLIAELNTRLDLPVYNESKLEGRYNFTIDWHAIFPNEMAGSLKKIGITLQKVKKEKDVLVVKRTKFQLSK